MMTIMGARNPSQSQRGSQRIMDAYGLSKVCANEHFVIMTSCTKCFETSTDCIIYEWRVRKIRGGTHVYKEVFDRKAPSDLR